MTPDQINRAIAELCGWFISAITRDSDIPNYYESLNACAEFEQPMNHAQLSGYVALLIRKLGVDEAIIAPATQRCEAFLRLHGKWTE